MRLLNLLLFLLFFSIQTITAQTITRGQLLRQFYLAQVAHNSGDDSTAIAKYREIIEVAPQLKETYLRLAEVYTKQIGKKPEALGGAIVYYRLYLDLEFDHAESEKIRSILNELEKRAEIETTPDMLVEETSPSPKDVPVMIDANNIVLPDIDKSKITVKLPKHEPQKNPELVELVAETPKQPEVEIPKEVVIPQKPGIEGRWCSSLRTENGQEMWIFDVRKMQNNTIRISLADCSGVSLSLDDKFFSSRTANVNYPSDYINFEFKINELYMPFEAKYSMAAETFKGIGELLLPKWLEWLPSVFGKFVEGVQKQDIPRTYETVFDFELEQSDNLLKGVFTSTYYEKAGNYEKPIEHKRTECAFYKVSDNYNGFNAGRPALLVDYEKTKYQGMFERIKTDVKTNANANLCLGVMYQHGVGVEQSEAKAVDCLLEAAKKGNVPAMNLLSRTYLDLSQSMDISKRTRASYQKNGLMWNDKAIQLGDTEAKCLLADYYYMDITNSNKAISLYMEASKEGSDYADNKLGEHFISSGNYTQGIEYFQKSVQKGNAQAIYNMALAYENGYGVKKDLAETVKRLEEAVGYGNINAITYLANLYMVGKGVKPNYNKANQLLKKKYELEAEQWKSEMAEYGCTL